MQNEKVQFKMQSFEHLHHANIVLGNREVLEILKNNLKEAGFETRGNADYLEQTITPFGIDEARDLSAWASGKPIAGERKVAVVVASHITPEAQNALLKTFEEPTPHTYFFLVLQNIGGVLATLLSRVQIIEFGDRAESQSQNFLQMKVGEQMALVKKLAKSEDKEPQRELVKNLPEKLDSASDYKMTKKILLAKRLASLRGSSPKMLLEWLVATM